MQFYFRQFAGDDAVMAMDLDAVGAHILLMCAAGSSEFGYRLASDEGAIRRRLRNPNDADFERIKRQLLSGAWKLTGDGDWWVQDGMRRSLLKQKEFSKKQSENARARWGNAKPMPDTCQTDAKPMPSSTSTSINTTITPPVSPKGELKKFGEKFLSMTEAQMKKCLEKYGKPLVDQELPNADEWIAESDTPNGRKYRKPGYNHYLFFSSTWMKSKRLEGNQPKLFKKPTTFDLNKGIIEELKEYDAGRKTEGMQAAIGIHLPAIPKGNH